ncbi:MAG: heme-binding protein [Deltaproteobacteria bacterium]|nr:heme-binding protein [Deltaproteobacteria bacterium]
MIAPRPRRNSPRAAPTATSASSAAQLAKSRPDRYFGIMNMYPGEVYLVGGGIPLAVGNRLVGAVGVAGLPQGVDDKAAEAGIAAWNRFREDMKK